MLLQQQQYITIAIFAFVYLLIVARRKFHIPIWTSMLIGAGLMIGFRVTSIESAFAINQTTDPNDLTADLEDGVAEGRVWEWINW